MSFLVVLIGVIVDRLMPALADYRNDAWFQAAYHNLFLRLPRDASWPGLVLAAVAVFVPAAVAWAGLWLLWQLSPFIAYVLGFVVFIFMLGPRGLFTDLQAYMDAIRAGDEAKRDRIAEALLAPRPLPASPGELTRAVITRLLVLAGRRLFGVIFWYVVLGPAGAVMFRAADILRHRSDLDSEAALEAAGRLYGVLEWAPSRLLALSYALAGSFDEAMAERRAYYGECQGRFFEINEDILACTGRGALSFASDGGGETEELEGASNLLFRALVIWLAVLALLSLLGWT
ncbi:MAG TPA: regulatory signaling modulator protein AmpE [Gammaproteobacteria bacterium]